MVYVTQALPAFLMSPITGPTADRRDRRRVIQTASLLQSVAAAGLLLVDSRSTLWIGYLCLCLISALGAFVPPAGQAGLPNLARDPDELRRASILFGSLWGTMLAVGAALGGLVASVFGREAAFVANVVSFVAAAVLVTTIRRPMQARRDGPSTTSRMRPIADMGEALTHARRDTVLLALLASKATFAIGAGIVGLLAVLATEELNGGDGATGLLLGARRCRRRPRAGDRRPPHRAVDVAPVADVRVLGTRLRRVLPRAERRPGAGDRRPAGVARPPRRWRPVDPVDLRPPAPCTRSTPRADPCRRLRDGDVDHHTLQRRGRRSPASRCAPGRRPCGPGSRAAAWDPSSPSPEWMPASSRCSMTPPM